MLQCMITWSTTSYKYIQDKNYDKSLKGNPFLVVWLDSTSSIFCFVHAIVCGDQRLLV